MPQQQQQKLYLGVLVTYVDVEKRPVNCLHMEYDGNFGNILVQTSGRMNTSLVQLSRQN